MSDSEPNGLVDASPCPRCGYDMRGLDLRCPECGAMFSSREALIEAQRPRLAFERASGLPILSAFGHTWLQSLLWPAGMARSLPNSTNARAIAFGVICFAATLLSLLFGANIQFVAAWIATGALYVLAQAMVLTIFFPERGQRSLTAVYGSWFRVGCYTSAIVMTEFVIGPPLVQPSQMAIYLVAPWLVENLSSGFARVFGQWLMLVVWLISLAFVIAERAAPRQRRSTRLWIGFAIAFLGLSHLYAVFVAHVGTTIYNWLDPAFGAR
ncbi:MAG: hypothetical protein KDA32_07590 [Phycisphaerales bacterium]|nr:hypothetical protein [Phycisphaerales bacterium]